MRHAPVRKALSYETQEKLSVTKPVDRVRYVSELCRGKRVLDLGCLDETALQKRETEHWLHSRIAAVAVEVIGIDSSDKLPTNGLQTFGNAAIRKGDATEPPPVDVDTIVAGELIEHLASPLGFLRNLKERFPGRELVLSTPNGGMFANTLLGLFGREAQHADHLQLFTYKTLNTLCTKATFQDWEIVPYHFFVTESLIGTTGAKRIGLLTLEKLVRAVERCFPLLSYGYVLRARL